MHESSLTKNLLAQIERAAPDEDGSRIGRVKLQLGALAAISPEHLREHLELAARGTRVEGAVIEIAVSEDIHNAHAQQVVLESVQVSDGRPPTADRRRSEVES
jgi:hydrogenase nickel incorporation protein HypA/HybF